MHRDAARLALPQDLHAVLIVGFGVDNGQSFWKIKNSWAKTWGEDGYIRAQKGLSETGILGLAMQASFPEL